MDDYIEDFNPFYESNDYLMSDSEEDEPAPEPEPEPEEPAPEPETPEEVPSELEPEEPAPEPEAPEEIIGEPEPEAPSDEEFGDGSETMKDLISAIGDLNETITGAVEQEPEQLPAGGEGNGGGSGGEVFVEEPASVDLTPVVRVLERNEKLLTRTNELLEQQREIMTTQHNDLLQLQANVDFVFLAVAALIGVVLGVAVGQVLDRIWRP